LAGVGFVFIASGAWIIEGRTTNTTAPAAKPPPNHSRKRFDLLAGSGVLSMGR
jgi:hypothetical protein